MKSLLWMTGIVLLYVVFMVSSCAVQKDTSPVVEAKKALPPEKAPEVKVKPIKAKGDIGLLDLEKNYMILVTKEGKLITVDFTNETKVTKITPTPSKMEDIGLGSSATVEYQTKADKKVITKIEYKAAKGGD